MRNGRQVFLVLRMTHYNRLKLAINPNKLEHLGLVIDKPAPPHESKLVAIFQSVQYVKESPP
jgi:hypothetical protein